MTAGQSNTPHQGWHPVAALAAWLVPGLGHVMIGQAPRGAIIGITIATLWLSGILIGGIGVLDRTVHPAWFLGQMLTAPSIVGDFVLQRHLKPAYIDPDMQQAAGRTTSYEPSFGRVREQGILYTALAGLLNLLAILDVIYRDPPPEISPAAAPAEVPA